MSLREDIRYRLDSLMVPDFSEKLDHTRVQIAGMQRRRDETRQLIPFWDRLMFFLDTPDEQLVGELHEQIEAAEEELTRLEGELVAATEKIGEEFPPYGLLLQIERCLRLAREELAIEGSFFKNDVEGRSELRETFDALADRVIQVWVPDFDPERLFAALSNEEACRDAAGDVREFDSHRRLGVEPTTTDRLVGPVAAKLLASEFFAEQKRFHELEARKAALTDEHKTAKDAVTFGAKLNVFTDSPEEERRNELAQELESTRVAALKSYETTRRLLHEALAAYAPLEIYQRVVEAMGVTTALAMGQEELLVTGGALQSRQVIAGRALVYAALRRILEACDRAFPEVPLPAGLSALATPAPDPSQALSPREELTRRFQRALESGWAPGVRAEALGHAAMCGALDERLERVRGQISLLDRMVFFSDSAAEQEEEELQVRAAWHQGEARERWSDLLEVARVSGSELGPFALRDLALDASVALSQVRTDGGSSSSPRSCSVYGRGEVVQALEGLQTLLRQWFGLRGTRSDLITDLLAHPPVELSDDVSRTVFERLTYELVLRRVAARLQKTKFAERVERSRELDKEKQQVGFDEKVVSEKIGLWDKINVFTTTPEEAERNELAEQLKYLGAELQDELAIIDRLLDTSLFHVYPPACLYYAVGGVLSAVSCICAVCVSYTVSTGTGKNRRTQTRYRCELRGVSTAQAALRGWCGKFLQTFGELPTYATLLEQGELEKIAALARAAEQEPDPQAR